MWCLMASPLMSEGLQCLFMQCNSSACISIIIANLSNIRLASLAALLCAQ